MFRDIVPELLRQIQLEFTKGIVNSRKLLVLLEKLELKLATYADANEQAIEVGEILARVLANTIKPEDLPNGMMYYNIAERILDPTLKTNHQLVTAYASDVQSILNEKAGLHIKPQIPAVNQERIDGLVNRISSEPFKIGKWLLSEPIVNFSQSIVDDMVKENAEFQFEAGLQPKVIRRSVGGCCDWCDGLAGTYNYPYDVPDDVWRRHRFCRCTVEYDPGDGKRRNVHTKKIPGSKEDREAQKRINDRQREAIEKEREERKKKRIESLQSGKIKIPPIQREFIVDLEYSPEKLGEYTPASLKSKLESLGFEVKPLGRGSLKNIKFEDGGGYRINYGGDSYLQYHPKDASHHGGEYYKMADGRRGARRFNLKGELDNG